jgi:glycosyltransferase involved in cell wall biosynthesis
MKPTVHIIGIPNTVLSREFDYSGFTIKARQIAGTLKPFGYPTIEYSNEGSESEADEKIILLPKEAIDPNTRKDGEGNPAFNAKVLSELKARIKQGDFVIHTLGNTVAAAVAALPQAIHVEWGVGYMAPGFGAYRIFESYAWMHYHHGQAQDVQGNDYDFVIPPSCNPAEWPLGKGNGGLIYFGRVNASKGIGVVRAVAEALKENIDVYGAGESKGWESPHLTFKGHLDSKDRPRIMGEAKAILCPTRYIEPGARVPIEAMMCGTPVIGPDFGCFSEYVKEGQTGYRNHTLKEYLSAVAAVKTLDRENIQRLAQYRFSIAETGIRYNVILEALADLWKDGWYTQRKTA